MQYLINLTGIWLLSLMVFDIFLRKESYHNYNRLYLLVTMLAGIIFPLVKWQLNTTPLYAAAERPVSNVITVKGNIVAATESASSVSWEQWLLVLYVVGAMVMTGLLVRDIIKLVSYYRAGKRSVIERWTLIETGKSHAPFSFLNLLFVSSREDYSDEEWQMLVEHEGRHTRLLHVVDLTVLQLGRIVFWFHPLVYVYNKRLLLVHEYQADNVGVRSPQVYGKFLVEQAVLHTAPSVAHSFNRSPIKKRILMLTRTSTKIARTKMVMVLPLTIACLVLFSQISYSKRFERQGNKVVYRGNTFECNDQIDSIVIIDPVTGAEDLRVTKRDGVPEKMNGKKIYKLPELAAPPQTYTQHGSIMEYVFMQLSDQLNKLPDGTYSLDINNIVIDATGKIVYYEGAGLVGTGDPVALKMKDAIADKIDAAMNNVPALKPGVVNGSNVAVLTDISFLDYEVEVKNHKSGIFKKSWK